MAERQVKLTQVVQKGKFPEKGTRIECMNSLSFVTPVFQPASLADRQVGPTNFMGRLRPGQFASATDSRSACAFMTTASPSPQLYSLS